MKFERDRHVNHWHNSLVGTDWTYVGAFIAFVAVVVFAFSK